MEVPSEVGFYGGAKYDWDLKMPIKIGLSLFLFGL